MGKINGELLWGKLMRIIYWENLWGKFMGKIYGENYTVVKRGHTEGIPREKTSSQKYTVIALHF